jgi:hypothetical protein
MIKNAGMKSFGLLLRPTAKIWFTETIPEEWNLSIICPIHKKRDVTSCTNCRGIGLLCITYKICSNILFERLSPYVENIIGDYQCGFHQGRSISEQIFNIYQILEKRSEFGIETHHLFIDFKAACDSIDRCYVYTVIEEFQIPHVLIALVKATMKNTVSSHTKNGLRQGDFLVCLLFNTALDRVMTDAGIWGTNFYRSAHADDIDITERTQGAMKETFISLEKAAKKMNLQINQEKTKYIPITKKGCVGGPPLIETDSYKFETVHNFTYLGSKVNCKNDINTEIKKRILSVGRCFYGFKNHLKSQLISMKIKLLMSKTLVRPVLTHACETWVLSKADERSFGLFEKRVIRCTFGAVHDKGTRRKRCNHELYKLFNEPNIITYIKSRDSAVGIATGYGLEDRGVGVQVPVGSRIFSSPRHPDRLWGPPSLLFNGYRGSFLGSKAAGA